MKAPTMMSDVDPCASTSVPRPPLPGVPSDDETSSFRVRQSSTFDETDHDGSPYKGQASYTVEDAHAFFGRENESADLSARILSSRLTVLHAPSGAGKTSLLNARIVPGLEAHGWFPVTSRPENDPVEAIRRNTLHTLFPPLETELLAFDMAARSLGIGDDQTLRDLLDEFDLQVDKDPERWRCLLMPVKNATSSPNGRAVPFVSASGVIPEFDNATPYFSRMLRRTVDISILASHFGAISRIGSERAAHEHGLNEETEDWLDEDTRIGTLRTILEDVALRQSYRALVGWLDRTPAGLQAFFETICRTYGAEFPSFGIVLILDQFEEVFTRFAGTPKTGRSRAGRRSAGSRSEDAALNWRLRATLFSELEKVYRLGRLSESTLAGSGVESRRLGDAVPADLPIRYVVSLRDEYVGRLGPLRRFATDLDRSMYRLAWLPAKEAEAAIREPARHAGYTYSDACVQQIIDGLSVEDGEIKPGPLQIVCQWVWRKRPAAETDRQIGVAALGPGGVDAIWSGFFDRYFARYLPFAQLALLDLLSPLITSHGTRNIVERSKLVKIRFWNRDLMEALLKYLDEDRLLRKERRLDTEFFEFMHEFLIDPVLDALDRSTDYRRLDRAFNSLARAAYEHRPEFELDREDFDTLDDPGIRSALDWKPWMNELMLRTAIVHDMTHAVERWADSYRLSPVSLEKLLTSDGPEGHRFLTSAELRQLGQATVNPVVYVRQIERVFESLVASPEPLETALSVQMARRLEVHVRRISRQAGR